MHAINWYTHAQSKNNTFVSRLGKKLNVYSCLITLGVSRNCERDGTIFIAYKQNQRNQTTDHIGIYIDNTFNF